MKRKILTLLLALTIGGSSVSVLAKSNKSLTINSLNSYSTGLSSEDGGVAEIVKFNSDNKKMYLVNGAEKAVDIVTVNKDETTEFYKRIDVSQMIDGFEFGDLTSIDINTKHKVIAVAVQEEQYDANGAILILDYEGNYITHFEAGVQPDMVTFTPDGNYVLCANEGEPRHGYGDNVTDPKGSITLVNIKKGVSNAVVTQSGFEKFDSEEKRKELIDNKVLLKKDAMPSDDLEPEYIAVDSKSKTAYISLQEANAIATLDIESGEITSVKGLGFKDHSVEGNEIDVVNDGKIDIKTQENLYGVYMPDGLALYESKGKTYILTPNEGDGREWVTKDFPHIDKANEFKNIKSITIDGKKVDALDNDKHDGLEDGKNYILGGRSFSIFDADTMELVFDSGSDFEKITAERYPENFNCSNKNITLDNRSGKKGPEPEDVKVGIVNGRAYAFVGLERIGGVMAYDITEPSEAEFVDYINTRDYSNSIAGDVAPEGLCFVSKEKSPTGKAMLLVANEVSGTVSLLDIVKQK